MKIAEAVATAWGRSLWATMMPSGDDAPDPAHEELTGEHAYDVSGHGEAEVRADPEGGASAMSHIAPTRRATTTARNNAICGAAADIPKPDGNNATITPDTKARRS